MDIVNLRTLTLKSKAFFYSDPNWTIEKLINDKSFVVLKTYYEQEKISFNQEVLDILKSKYSNFIEIDKPSKIKGWHDIIFKNNYHEMTYDRLKKICIYQKLKYGQVNKEIWLIMKKKKSEMINSESKSRLQISKKDLQGKNHGK
tara:strand:- start:832 stop:1266 length:435 start_codon:yes stop_codon:yes gene_type:complete